MDTQTAYTMSANPRNGLFAKNMANRIWAHFFHRGLVEPVDDMRVSNPPTNGPLLDALAQRFVESGYDLRALVSDICKSRVYQLSSEPNETNKLDSRQFSRVRLRRLRADVLLDSICAATEWERTYPNFPKGTKAIQFYPRTPGDTTLPLYGDDFFKTFGRSNRSSIWSRMIRAMVTILMQLAPASRSAAPRKGSATSSRMMRTTVFSHHGRIGCDTG